MTYCMKIFEIRVQLALDGAVNRIVSNHGRKPLKALQAAFDILCPDSGAIVAGDYINESSDIVAAVGDLYDAFGEAGLSCGAAQAGFKIPI